MMLLWEGWLFPSCRLGIDEEPIDVARVLQRIWRLIWGHQTVMQVHTPLDFVAAPFCGTLRMFAVVDRGVVLPFSGSPPTSTKQDLFDFSHMCSIFRFFSFSFIPNKLHSRPRFNLQFSAFVLTLSMRFRFLRITSFALYSSFWINSISTLNTLIS